MAGPYQQYPEPYPAHPTFPTAQAPPRSEYPGMLPPPVPYPKRRRWRAIAVILMAVVVVAGIAAAIVYGVRSGDRSASNELTSAGAATAIQNYLDAMSNADVETIARNTLCGMYDAVRDKRADQALAKLSSDAFRKQFTRAEVTSIDKMVYWSPNQAQVLFTMRVMLAASGGQNHEEQAVAQLLAQDNLVLVCSYVLRNSSVY